MGLGGFGGAGLEGPPNVTVGAGQAPPLTGCLRPYSYIQDQIMRFLTRYTCEKCICPQVAPTRTPGRAALAPLPPLSLLLLFTHRDAIKSGRRGAGQRPRRGYH